jgi:hypothetical protein
MNYWVKMLVMAMCMIIVCGVYASDKNVVKAIHKVTHVTDKDIEKWKLLWLGKENADMPIDDDTGESVMAAAGKKVLDVAQSFQLEPEPGTSLIDTFIYERIIKKIADWLRRYGPAISGKRQDQDIVSNSWLWAFLGASKTGPIAYKLLYPRAEREILDKVKRYADYGESLDVCRFVYQSEQSLNTIGNSAGNDAWKASNRARLKGVLDLIEQGHIALQLLGYLKDSQEKKQLKNRVTMITIRLQNNVLILKMVAEKEDPISQDTDVISHDDEQPATVLTTINNFFKTSLVWLWRSVF